MSKINSISVIWEFKFGYWGTRERGGNRDMSTSNYRPNKGDIFTQQGDE